MSQYMFNLVGWQISVCDTFYSIVIHYKYIPVSLNAAVLYFKLLSDT